MSNKNHFYKDIKIKIEKFVNEDTNKINNIIEIILELLIFHKRLFLKQCYLK